MFWFSDELIEKQSASAELSERYNRANNEYNTKKDKLRELKHEAEKIAPSEVWQERLSKEDVPTTLEDVENEIDEAELKVSCFDSAHCDFSQFLITQP